MRFCAAESKTWRRVSSTWPEIRRANSRLTAAHAAISRGDLLFEPRQSLRLAFELQQGLQLLADLGEIELAVLACQDALHIAPVQIAPGEDFVDQAGESFSLCPVEECLLLH